MSESTQEKQSASELLARKLVEELLSDPKYEHLAYVKEDHRYWNYNSIDHRWSYWGPDAMRMDPRLRSNAAWMQFKLALDALGRIYDSKAYSFGAGGDHLNLMLTDHWLKPEPPTANTRFLEYVLASLGNDKPENIKHLMQVVGWKYLHPETWQLPALCLYGRGRSGKNLFASTIMSMIFGQHQCLTTTFNKVQKFDSALAGKVIVMFDEQPNREEQSRLKEIVGNPTLEVEAKGCNTYKTDNTALYIIATNEPTGPVKIEHNGTETRFSFIRSDISLAELIAQKEKITKEEALTLIDEVDKTVFRNPREVAGLLQLCIDEANKLTSAPKAHHGEDFKVLSTTQRDVTDDIMDEVFNYENFDYITLQTLYAIYVKRAKETNQGAYPMATPRFNARVQEQIARRYPHIRYHDRRENIMQQAKPVKAYVYYQHDRYILGFFKPSKPEPTDLYLSGAFLAEPSKQKLALLTSAITAA